jgi:hypothetical protein
VTSSRQVGEARAVDATDSGGSPSSTLPGVLGNEPIDERTYSDGSCCGLKPNHEGCCAFMCSDCDGLGRTRCRFDDLGCDCGYCDGYGYCSECGGQGWFNEMGESCFVGREEWGHTIVTIDPESSSFTIGTP